MCVCVNRDNLIKHVCKKRKRSHTQTHDMNNPTQHTTRTTCAADHTKNHPL